MARVAIAVLLALTLSRSQEKARVPAEPAQKNAETLIKGIFKDEYAKKTPESQLALAKKLLQQGRETSNDPAAQYVLFREAADLASRAGEVALALDAAKAMSDSFDVEPLGLKTKLLQDIPPTFRAPDLARTFAELSMAVAGEAVALDRVDEAKGVLAKAEAAAKSAKDLGLLNRVQKQKRDLDALQAELQKAKAAEITLQASPNDPAANLALGRYLVAKGKLDQAIAHFAKGSDATLKAAAEKDVAAPKEAEAQTQAGNAWWDAAEKEKEGPFRKALQERARGWYESAYVASSGLSRVVIDKRLDALDRAGSSAPDAPPSLRVLTFAQFDALAAQYPHEQDLAAKYGKATASTQYENRDPDNVFKGNRRSDAWTLGVSPGWFEAKWSPPVRARTLILVGRNAPAGADSWGQATLLLNGTTKLPLNGMSGGHVVIVELGSARRLESVRAEIPAIGGHPGLGTLEVFR